VDFGHVLAGFLIIADVVYRFGTFKLDTDVYELRSGREVVPAEPKVLEVLDYLVAQRHRVVSKQELVELIWKEQFVSDSAVSRAIREIRRYLGDSAAKSKWIKTVYGRGFRFVGEVVETLQEKADPSPKIGTDPLPISLTPLIGREQELEAVCALLAGARLLTLTGIGGVGKTRLALEVARRSSKHFPAGAALIPLAEIAESERVAGAIALALKCGDAAGSSVVEAIRQSIGEREMLLILDNFEQVWAAADVVSGLLGDCPNLKILVTSRSVLQVDGEQEYPLEPLALPPKGASEHALQSAPSVALFLDRARAVRPDFRPEGRDLDYLAEVCRRLDGLPLAIELAAARIKILSPQELWQRLVESLDLLSSPSVGRPQRHQTLQLALDWSHELLDESERTLLRRLAVFGGGFSLSAVESTCGLSSASIVDLLTALVDKSLVSRLPMVAEESRLGLLETTRSFAWARLEASGEAAELQRAHADWILNLVRRGEKQLVGGDQEIWLQRLDAEHGNVMAAIAWARSGGDLERGMATGAAFARYWSARGFYREGRSELESLVTCSRDIKVAPTVKADALMASGMLCLLLCDFSAATESLDEALKILRPLGDQERLAQALNHLGWVVAQGHELERAESISREALTLHRELGNARGISVALNNLGWLAMYKGDAEGSEEFFREALTERRAAGDERGTAFALANLAMVRVRLTEQWEEVDDWLNEAQGLVERLGDRPLGGWVSCARGALAACRGAWEEAVELLEESAMIDRETDHPDGRAWNLLLLGEVLAACGQHHTAHSRFLAARQIWTEIDVPWGISQAERRLAELARSAGDTEAACKHYRESLALSETIGDKTTANACRQALAEIGAASDSTTKS
jgi:predicted ATPase